MLIHRCPSSIIQSRKWRPLMNTYLLVFGQSLPEFAGSQMKLVAIRWKPCAERFLGSNFEFENIRSATFLNLSKEGPKRNVFSEVLESVRRKTIKRQEKAKRF